MSGWLILALIAGVAALALWRMRVPRALGSFVGAAMMLGATGYAVMGNPGLAGHPVTAALEKRDYNPEAVTLRDQMFGRFTFADTYLKPADVMLADGKPALAVQVILGGLYKSPRDPALWTGLGLAFQENDGGQLSPAALLAFSQAMQVAPKHPGPPLFHGQALIRTGDMAGAQRAWAHALALAPPGSQMRREIMLRLALLDMLIQRDAAAQAKAAASR